MMRELSVNEVEQVDGAILPFVAAVVAVDAGLIAAMIGAGYW